MGKLLVLLAGAIGALAFWRRKTLKEDATKVSDAAKGGVERIKGGAADVADAAVDSVDDALDA